MIYNISTNVHAVIVLPVHIALNMSTRLIVHFNRVSSLCRQRSFQMAPQLLSPQNTRRESSTQPTLPPFGIPLSQDLMILTKAVLNLPKIAYTVCTLHFMHNIS